MAAVHVRNVPDEIVARLERMAAANGHTMQEEILRILEEATRDIRDTQPLPPIRLVMAPAPAQGRWRREDIYGDDGR